MRVGNCDKIGHWAVVLGLSVILLCLGLEAKAAPPLPGAIFTTTVDGSIVNENVRYEAKEDVYLDGGPGPNAPSTAAGLPEGDYYFQVTDPSGKDLLSTDHISCRRIHVNENGVIDFVYGGTNLMKEQGIWLEIPCQHAQGVDQDHAELGAITVQLFPYDDTPNKGGVYKVWITPVEDYVGVLPNCAGQKGQCNVNGENWEPANVHGFIPAKSKTDNYKVYKKGPQPDDPKLSVRKFHDRNANGIWDADEEEILGWAIDITDPLGVTNRRYTSITEYPLVPSGEWTITEATPPSTLQTVSMLNGNIISQYPDADPTVCIEVVKDDTYDVVYGNVGLGVITACKIYDRNADGETDNDEPGIPSWQMKLTGTDITGAVVGPIVQFAGEYGCTTFSGLLPGTYNVTEVVPSTGEWIATSPTSIDDTIESSLDRSAVVGTSSGVTFTNACLGGEADFDTKGYWHNKNGLDELTQADINYVNVLDPYNNPTDYFDAGDEPFDGLFSDGTPVEAAYNNDNITGEISAGEGTPKAEVSHFLVDRNAGGDPREQLAQQLLAFIFNTRHRLDYPGATIELPDGCLVSASDLITQAIAIWQSGTPEEQNQMQELLNDLNNNDAVRYIPYVPCDVVYP